MSATLNVENPALGLALCKLFGEKEVTKARAMIRAGKYEIDEIIHVKGNLSVGEDYETTSVQKLNPWTLFLIAMNKLNGTTIEAIVDEACAKLDAGETPELADFKAKTEKAAEKLLKRATTTAKGRCSFDGIISPAGIEAGA